jgi:magnesium transporter
MPTRDEMREIEASSRVYEEADALFMTATLPFLADNPPPETTEVTFVLSGDRLITLRYADPQPFRTIAARLERAGAGLGSGIAVLLWLIDCATGRIADILERAVLDIDDLSRDIFRAAGATVATGGQPDLVEAIARVGRNGDTATKLHECLHTLHRLLLVVGTSERIVLTARKEARQRAKMLNRDVLSLTEYSDFLSHRSQFLLDATLGLINIQQTNIIKIFSVLAIVFLPPTLIASIYGMNFNDMPELSWKLGYPFSILLMILAAIVPFWLFRRKGWL